MATISSLSKSRNSVISQGAVSLRLQQSSLQLLGTTASKTSKAPASILNPFGSKQTLALPGGGSNNSKLISKLRTKEPTVKTVNALGDTPDPQPFEVEDEDEDDDEFDGI